MRDMMTNMPKLKPCPFCGGGSTIHNGNIFGQWVGCNSCSCKLGSIDDMYEVNGDFDGVGDAKRAWNTRADLHAELVKAADELAAAVDAEHNMVCQDFGMQLEASNRVCAALTAYKQAKEKLK